MLLHCCACVSAVQLICGPSLHYHDTRLSRHDTITAQGVVDCTAADASGQSS